MEKGGTVKGMIEEKDLVQASIHLNLIEFQLNLALIFHLYLHDFVFALTDS